MYTYAYLFVQCKQTLSIAWLENFVEMYLWFAQVDFKYAWISPNFAHLGEDYAAASRFSTAWLLGLFTAYSLIHCRFVFFFFNVSSTNMKELERVHRHKAWQIVGIALVLPHTKEVSLLLLRWTNLHQAASLNYL